MRVRYLGTSAGELYPGLWCRCRSCEAARTGPAENRRQSATVYVEPHDPPDPAAGLLIDFPSEIASQVQRHGVDLSALQDLLVTHSHGDHWFPYLLRWRSSPGSSCGVGEPAPLVGGARHTPLPVLRVWGNAAVEVVLRRELGDDLHAYALEFNRVRAGDRFAAGTFTVMALAANHDIGREDAVHYVLTDGQRTMLYGLDGDTFLDATREALCANRFDLVILESTYGFGDGRNHRNFARVIEEAAWFREQGLLNPGGRIVATHFSPHHAPPHAETRAYLAEHDIDAAYDGMEVSL